MSRRWNEIHRKDSTEQALVDEVRALGGKYLSIGGAIDGLIFFKASIFVVDFKGPKTKLTKRQSKLLEDGFPVRVIRTSEELRQMLTEVA